MRPKNPVFSWIRRSQSVIDGIKRGYDEIRQSPDFFGSTDIVPREVPPYQFSYKYYDELGKLHDQKCHDWEIERTFLNWRDNYGEDRTLTEMRRVFGEEYPSKGMVLAMGTHGQRNWQWMIIGIIRLDEIDQPSFL